MWRTSWHLALELRTAEGAVTSLFILLASIHTHANASGHNRKLNVKSFAFRCVPNVKFGCEFVSREDMSPVDDRYVT